VFVVRAARGRRCARRLAAARPVRRVRRVPGLRVVRRGRAAGLPNIRRERFPAVRGTRAEVRVRRRPPVFPRLRPPVARHYGTAGRAPAEDTAIARALRVPVQRRPRR